MISISAPNSEKYYWMRYISSRATNVQTKTGTAKIVQNDLFGVRELKGTGFDEIVLTDGTRFKLQIAKSEQLMNRAKEFKGKTPVLEAAKVQKAPILVKARAKADQTPSEQKFARWAKSLGYSKDNKSSLTLAAFKTLLAKCLTDQERLALKRWVLSNLTRGSVKYQKVGQYNVVAQKQLTALVVKRSNVQITEKLGTSKRTVTVTKNKTNTRVTKLSPALQDDDDRPVNLLKVDFPDLEDFSDHEVPLEFRKFARVESSDIRFLSCLASEEEITASSVSTEDSDDFQNIVKHTLEPHIKNAKKMLETGVKAASAKIRAWAITHLGQAKKLGHNTVLFEKLINDPDQAARQLAYTLLGVNNAAQTVKREQQQLDDLLGNISLPGF